MVLKIRYLVLVIYSRKLALTQKLMKLKRKLLIIIKYITAPEFNKLTPKNLTARLKRANLASKNDIANYVNKTDFDNKLKDVTSNKNELNELSKKVKAISTKIC